ncbi:MAG: Arc family DNA binding domain-containing protein [Bacteroidetes bacterium]|nr:Arc family DNA binding domain-containing protein [Bacteroidota bacterium]
MSEKSEKKSLVLRIDPRLWEDLNRMASDELRSLNGQIEYLLRESVRQWKGHRKTHPPSPPEPTKEAEP